MVKRNLGRQKVEMVKMTNESNLNVTFSKRRTGLFKKGSELSTLCGVELALVVFSPGKKVYSFGHPSVDSVIDRYFGRNTAETSMASQLVEANRESTVQQLNMELTQFTDQLEEKRKRGEELKQMKKENQQQYRWQSPVEELDLSTLGQLKSAMVGLKKDVQTQKLALLGVNPHLFYMGSSSGNRVVHDYRTNNNNVAFDGNMMNGGYIVPDPAQGYNLNPFEGCNANPAQGYNLNPVEECNANPAQGYNYNLNPVEGYNANPSQGYDMNPVEGYNANPSQGYDMNPVEGYNANPQPQGHSANPSEGYNMTNPIPADDYNANPLDFPIHSPLGFGGGYDVNPLGNDILGFGPQGFEGGFF